MGKKILVTTDFSEASYQAFACAAKLAQEGGGTIMLFSAVPDWQLPADFIEMLPATAPAQIDTYRAMLQADAEKKLEGLAARFPGIAVQCRAQLTTRSAAEDIVQFALKQSADMIVMSSHGHGAFGNMLLGSTMNKVLKTAPCPVVVVPHRT